MKVWSSTRISSQKETSCVRLLYIFFLLLVWLLHRKLPTGIIKLCWCESFYGEVSPFSGFVYIAILAWHLQVIKVIYFTYLVLKTSLGFDIWIWGLLLGWKFCGDFFKSSRKKMVLVTEGPFGRFDILSHTSVQRLHQCNRPLRQMWIKCKLQTETSCFSSLFKRGRVLTDRHVKLRLPVSAVYSKEVMFWQTDMTNWDFLFQVHS